MVGLSSLLSIKDKMSKEINEYMRKYSKTMCTKVTGLPFIMAIKI